MTDGTGTVRVTEGVRDGLGGRDRDTDDDRVLDALAVGDGATDLLRLGDGATDRLTLALAEAERVVEGLPVLDTATQARETEPSLPAP